MKEATGLALASIFLLGIGAQWLAWRFRAPAILLLLVVGLIAGPATGFLNPDEVFGRELILSIVSFSVAVIMFEGGLSLKFKDIKEVGGTVISLVTVGMLVSWGVSTVAGVYIFDMEWNVAALIGGILVVTGPTVIGPLLRQIRPKKRIGSILKWEGIMIDPIGALAAVLVFEAVILEATNPRAEIFNAIMLTLGAGLAGLVCAALMVVFIRRFWIPEFLHSPFMLMVVIGTFALSNQIQSESGLLTVTVLGLRSPTRSS
ncbi:MAG: cation:proton antiporter [Fimbriimonadaceae bacterium]